MLTKNVQREIRYLPSQVSSFEKNINKDVRFRINHFFHILKLKSKMNFFSAVLSLTIVLGCLARDPTPIPPKNPNDPLVLPAGVTKKVLVVGMFGCI